MFSKAMWTEQMVTLVGGDSLPAGKQMAYKEYNDLKSTLRPGNDTLRSPTRGIIPSPARRSCSGAASISANCCAPSSLISEHDLRFYFETVLMGTKNYPTFYEKPLERTVTLLGFNFPTFGLLNLLSLEMEYAPTPWKMSTDRAHGGALAVPIGEGSGLQAGNFPNEFRYSRDDWKWTLLARKNLYPGLALLFQAANDHMRLLDNYSSQSQYDIFSTPQHWYWAFSLKYAI